MASQFGSGNKNPPWARQATDFMAASAVGGMAGASMPQTGLQTAAAGVALSQPGMAMPTTLGAGTTQVATVSYPTARATQATTTAAAANQKQRVFTGTVTKLHDNFGFIDEDVFFQTNCVKGMVPKVGDRVLVEASYNPAMPFKWNATRVQVLSNAQPAMVANAQAAVNQQQLSAMQQAVKSMGLGAMGAAPGAVNPGGVLGGVNPLQLAGAMAAMSNAGLMRGASGVNRQNYNDSSRFSEDRERDRDRRERDRREKRDSRRRSRSSSPASRTRSPKRKASRPPPRYVVQIPHFTLNQREANVIMLKSKYSNMYIPSDFFHTSFPWVDNLPLQRPFVLGQPCKFHVMHKEVGPLTPETAVLDPPDADHKYCAKVMLLTSPSMEELYSKSCALAQDPSDAQESFQHPTRLLQFLVGTRGKNEPMAIGGPWSPSLDGADPDENPQVLIKTAIRTTKALTSIDLSKCTQWYRFAEIRYLRAESRDKPARVETVVLFLPDVWRCSPSRLEWTSLQKAYAQKLQKKLNPDAAESEDPQALTPMSYLLISEGSHVLVFTSGKCAISSADKTLVPNWHFRAAFRVWWFLECLCHLYYIETPAAEGAEVKREPTHYSQLDPKTLKLQELRDELDSRNLSSKGLKSQLIARLTKALLLEEETESNAEAKKEDEEQKRKEKKERQQLEKRYAIPDSPAIIVHPNPTAKSGKFDCSVMTLSVLLDYRPEDNKEHSFEVSLFAEMFNEMLMRDFGFTIYKALEPPAKKRKVDSSRDGDDDDDDRKDKDKKDSKRDKRKFETVDPDLLLACVYYDQNHCSYIQDRDLEDIIQSLGLDLSRAQVRKLVQKVIVKESFHYRKLCDQLQAKEGETAQPRATVPYDLDVIARGNAEHLTSVRMSMKVGQGSPSTRGGKAASGKVEEFVTYRGSVIDLDSLMQKLEGSDKSRSLLENKLADMTSQLTTVKSNLASQEAAVKSVKQELVNTQAKLQAEISQRMSLETQHGQWEAAAVQAKGSLQHALSLLSAIGPQLKEEDRAREADVKKKEESGVKKKEEAVSAKKEK
ncbi:hypothetical protein BaRGS_00015430 [Batillaria attramentaria]|uniref:SAP domain-containing protein n=1 Tax=Batillaria attramentaria TaxID=370345 RepID=A0ABD0L1D6_9CAEN